MRKGGVDGHGLALWCDWAEEGQNSMMAPISVVGLFGMSWQTWSVDSALGLF